MIIYVILLFLLVFSYYKLRLYLFYDFRVFFCGSYMECGGFCFGVFFFFDGFVVQLFVGVL